MDDYFFDPYAKKRRLARQARQARLDKIVSSDLPVDGDAVETRRPTAAVGGLMDAVMESVARELYRDEARFFDRLREQWAELFPGCPARPGRWQDGKLVLYVGTAGQSFALRPKLPAMKKRILALDGAPKGRFALLVEIKGR